MLPCIVLLCLGLRVSATTFTVGVLASGDAFVDPDIIAMMNATTAINADASILSGHTLALDIRRHTTPNELWASVVELVPNSNNLAIIGAYLSSSTLKARASLDEMS
jgi:hypothetical protein